MTCHKSRRERAWRLVIVTVLGLAAASCGGKPAPAASAPPVSSLTVKSCTVDGLAARCGTLIVPEDRLTGQGRTIPVRFVVFPATGPDRAPDPLVYFAGGPGDSAINDIPTRLPGFMSLNLNRDLVFIEQRGTGQSNPLNCPAFPTTLADKAALRASVQSCLAHLRGDLQFYTTAMFTDDVSQILTDLHYTKAYQALHASELAPIPVLVHTLGAATNKAAALVSVFKALQAAGLTGTGGGATPMMQYEIVCAEPWASDPPVALADQRASFAYQMNLESAQWNQYVCPLIPRSAAAVGSQQLTASRVPVLAFSGDADPTDQPRNMAGMQQFWPDSLDIALPGQGHSLTSDSWPCESALIQVFIQQASVAHLDTGCVAAIPTPAFPLTLQDLAASG